MSDLPERHETQPGQPSPCHLTRTRPPTSHTRRTVSAESLSGASAGRFELREEVGRGGMGAVVRGTTRTWVGTSR